MRLFQSPRLVTLVQYIALVVWLIRARLVTIPCPVAVEPVDEIAVLGHFDHFDSPRARRHLE